MSIVNHGHGAGSAGFPHHLDPAGRDPSVMSHLPSGAASTGRPIGANAMRNQDTVEDTLAQRGKTYGDFTDHARICQQIKDDMVHVQGSKWKQLSDVQKQALEVIADKIARILSGDPNYSDNWHDIQGYAKLVEDRLPK